MIQSVCVDLQTVYRLLYKSRGGTKRSEEEVSLRSLSETFEKRSKNLTDKKFKVSLK